MAAKDVKMVFVGSGAVGKTCLLYSYFHDVFPPEYIPTVFDTYDYTFPLNGQDYKIKAWDTAGQDEYDRLRPLSYPSAHIFVICFSVLDRESFDKIESKWIPEIEHHLPGRPTFIVGCKDDDDKEKPHEDWPEKELLIHGYTKMIQDNIPFELLDVIGIYIGYMKIHFDAQKLCNSYENIYGYFSCSAKENRGLKELFTEIMTQMYCSSGKNKIAIINEGEAKCCIII